VAIERKLDVLVYVHTYGLCVAIIHLYVRILNCIYLTSLTCNVCLTITYQATNVKGSYSKSFLLCRLSNSPITHAGCDMDEILKTFFLHYLPIDARI
jgi:hypothetical protein